MKWTYKKLKKNKIIQVGIVDDNHAIQIIEGMIGEQMKEDVPEWNIKKGDFWIDCPSLKEKLLCKLDFIMNNYEKPCVFFIHNKYKYLTGLKQSIKRI